MTSLKPTVLILLVIICSFCQAQDTGLREAYRHFNQGTVFHRGLYIGGDTIAIYGDTFDSLTNRKFAFYGLLDTLGQPLIWQDLTDSIPAYFSINYASAMLRLRDGKIILGGFYLSNVQENYLMCIDIDGTILWRTLVPFNDPNSEFRFMRNAADVGNGIILGGGQYTQETLVDVVVMKFDYDGNKLWETTLGDPVWSEVVNNITHTKNNDIILGVSKFNNGNGPDNLINYSQIYKLSQIGVVIDQWQSANDDFDAPFDVHETSDSGYILIAYETYSINDCRDRTVFGGHRIAVRLDMDFNELWRRRINNTTYQTLNANSNLNLDMKKTGDEEYTTIASLIPIQWNPAEEPTIHNTEVGGCEFQGFRAFCLHRYDEDGNELLVNCDTLDYFNYAKDTSLNESWQSFLIRDNIVLPSGSIISLGAISNLDLISNFGILAKWDKNGCITPDCERVEIPRLSTSTSEPIADDDPGSAVIYPNPSITGQYYFHFDKPIDAVEIFDIHGKMINFTRSFSDSLMNIKLASNIPSGIYILKIKQGTESSIYKLLK